MNQIELSKNLKNKDLKYKHDLIMEIKKMKFKIKIDYFYIFNKHRVK